MKFLKKIIIPIILIIILFLIIFYVVENFSTKETLAIMLKPNYILESSICSITKYTVYGTHLNFCGILDDVNYDITDAKIIFKNNNNELEYDVIYSKQNNSISFSTSDEINSGIYLENIPENNYNILLKLTTNGNKDLYYLVRNDTEYNNIEYYTLSTNGINAKVNIFTQDDYIMCISVNETEVPNEVYDIVIDPGHGGEDVGASFNEYYESDIVLEYAILLKKSLENAGYKVLLTRDTDVNVNAYDTDGRAVIPNTVKAKLCLSLHLNSNEIQLSSGGVEIYAASNTNLTFAKSLADNIVSIASTTYSPNSSFRQMNGVYVKNFTEGEIQEANLYAKKVGYSNYTITTSTPYLFMLREIGGIMTSAYIDGRNEYYGVNPYYNSNICCESYLLELGYINYQKDLDNLLNNTKAYIQAITKSIVDNYS